MNRWDARRAGPASPSLLGPLGLVVLAACSQSSVGSVVANTPIDSGPGMVIDLDAGLRAGDGAACLPLVSCTVFGGQYCGVIGDGCSGTLDCGACPAGLACLHGVCADPSVADGGATSCTVAGGSYCGDIGDGMGGLLACGACSFDQTCINHQCVPNTGCTPLTCNPTGGQYCGGVFGDGCGGSITCGDCTTPGWTCQDHLCKGDASCIPVSCGHGPDKYCGTIGDGCGSVLECGGCTTGETCVNNACIPATCTPRTCTSSGGQYCGGAVPDGCGGTINCSAPCANGWECSNHLCVGGPTCKPLTACNNGTPYNYCGTIGDGCGGTLECGDDCTAGQVCDAATGRCRGDAACVPATCANGTPFNYCGDIGDGCGGTLSCGTDCAAGQVCDPASGQCKGDVACVPGTCSNGTAFSYCGDIGDGCGNVLHCPSTCAAGQACSAGGVCTGDATCTRISCSNGTPFNYCGDVGDGCGGTLSCGADCGPDQTCGSGGLCRGNVSCTPITCRNAGGYAYCGLIGDGCGGTLDCTAGCPTGFTCANNLCIGDASCSPRTSCTTDAGYRYCGTIGDDCGGTLDCGKDCGTGKLCDATKNLCVGDATCVPLTCATANGGHYCGGTIGDGCGGSLACNDPCPANTACKNNVCACDGSLICQLAKCDSGATTITGTVYDPAGANPVYNATVYIPNSTIDPISHGPTCDQCGSLSGNPIAAALSGPDGSFTLTNVPSGTNIPLVMQIGKWRRQVEIPSVPACQTTKLPASLTHLPRNQHDGDDGTVSLPRIALAAGQVDRLQCLLLRMGVDAAEFTNPGQGGSISMYQESSNPGKCVGFDGSSATYPDATAHLWDSQTDLNQYDMVVLNCGGDVAAADPTTNNTYISHPGAVDRMKAFVDAGGRVFAEHYQWSWIRSYPGFPSTFGEVASWDDNTGLLGSPPRDVLIDMTFPKGAALANWLVNVGASSTLGSLTVRSDIHATATQVITPPSQRWIYESFDGPHTHYFSFNTPVGAASASQCGRFVYTGFHVTDTSYDPGDNIPGTSQYTTFPGCCAGGQLTNQEKVLEFMLFDLSSCISDQTLSPPAVPTTPAPALPPPPASLPPPVAPVAAPPSAPPLPPHLPPLAVPPMSTARPVPPAPSPPLPPPSALPAPPVSPPSAAPPSLPIPAPPPAPPNILL